MSSSKVQAATRLPPIIPVLGQTVLPHPLSCMALTAAMSLKACHITELKSLANPPRDVTTTLTACMILMGYQADDWRTCQKCLAQPDLFKSMMQFDVSKVTSQQVGQAREKLHGLDPTSIMKVNFAAGQLFRWVAKTLEEAESVQGKGGADKTHQ